MMPRLVPPKRSLTMSVSRRQVMPQSRPSFRAAIAFCFFMLLVAPEVRAQEATTITFNDAVRIALEQNIALRQAENVVASREISVSRQRMNFYPTLSLSSSGRSEEHTSELQSRGHLVCRLLL